MNIVQQCIHMYVNAKMMHAETVTGIRGGEMGGEQWRGV
jgi:hypothetical protein